ncbi:PGN_0703 family putative restriction endonuclease [Nocardioides ganghwensis]|uniref:Uncharacterized protein n=1 Tax=Nocardioides ganghwensis TaxID=252230 RepID=A0A4Q2SBW2_9ACTN|nr:hypothetical protein [Nocardioides ganghwensis]MBD3947549.1 hypothetical protein [Nocardioides ganghwensis]RYB99431.1 hypothetical protein EUA07_16535 [Nocardioides ganghwensis]
MNKVQTSPGTYVNEQNRQAVAWKHRSPVLPADARRPGYYRGDRGPYPVCLPGEHASYNLLPEVRDAAIALFHELDIPWHDGVDSGPSNHLRDSQVQCVNALFAMVADAGRIKLAFGGAVDIAEVLPIEEGRFLTFEYIGPTDYFGEGFRGGREVGRRRGTHCTSVDAAFLYKTSAGVVELALVEWKFTECYLDAKNRAEASDAVRIAQYAADLDATDSPIDLSVLPMELLLDEPFYQLTRQQLLANRLEQDRILGADVVRVLHVLSPENTGYQDSLVRAEHRAAGATVDEVWSELLRTPDRFVHIDPAVFLDPVVTSAEYVDRYGPAVARLSPPDANAGARPTPRLASGALFGKGTA